MSRGRHHRSWAATRDKTPSRFGGSWMPTYRSKSHRSRPREFGVHLVMTECQFGRYLFRLVQEVRPDTDVLGIREPRHPLSPGVRPIGTVRDPSVRFGVLMYSRRRGVYALTVGNQLQYIGECGALGECDNLAAGFGPTGCGRIPPLSSPTMAKGPTQNQCFDSRFV
jgi:hypothetical protein